MIDQRPTRLVLWIHSVLGAAIAWLCAPSLYAEALETQTLCERIVSPKLAETLRVEFEFRQFHGDEAALAQQTSHDHIFVSQGDDWILRTKGHGNFQMKRGDALLTFTDLKGKRGQRSQQLTLSAPLSLASALETMELARVARLGTVPTNAQVEFIRSAAARAMRLPAESIEGAPVEVIEWHVPRSDYDEAFQWISPALAREESGRLRLYIDPALGDVIRRLEYRLPNNNVVLRRDSTDLRRISDDFHFPFLQQTMIETNATTYRDEYRIVAVTHVNHPLPADEFTLNIPLGTRVYDERPGIPHTRFRLVDEQQLNILNRVITPNDRVQVPMTWRTKILMLQTLLFGSLIVYQCVRKWRAAKTASSNH